MTISQKKWSRVKNILKQWKGKFDENHELPLINYKKLERDLGFLVHVSMTYEKIKPFLRGFYLTLKIRGGKGETKRVGNCQIRHTNSF